MFDALSHPSRRRILLLVSEHSRRDDEVLGVEEIAPLLHLIHDNQDELPTEWP